MGPDGSIVVAGHVMFSGNPDYTLGVARFTADGQLDTSFNGTGTYTAPYIDNWDWVFDVAVQSDGKIVTSGEAGGYQHVTRLLSDGTLDSSFGSGGTYTPALGSWYSEGGMVLQSDGKIVIGGSVNDGWQGRDFDFLMLRYLPSNLVTTGNVPPTVSISGPSSVSNLDVYTLNLSATYVNDPDGDSITGWTVDWGDGGMPQTIDGNPSSITHVFATPSNTPYPIMATASDQDGSYPAQTTVQVTQNPVTFYVTGDSTYVVGQPYTLTPTFSDPGGSTPSSYFIDWGDGHTDSISGNPSSFTHTYLSGDEDYSISVAVTAGSNTYNAQAAVGELSPTLLSGGSSVTEGSAYTLNTSVTDGDSDSTYNWEIDWGDGSEMQDLTAAPGALTHVYSSPGSYLITAIADDELAGDVQTLNVQVNETTPALSLSGASSVVEASQYTLTDAFNDPGGLPVDSWTIDWGDGNIDASYQDPGQFAHAYADTGTYTITGTATTQDDSYSVTKTVTVQEATPTFTIDPAGQITEGSTAVIQTHFNDPGGDTPTSWTVAWGDGYTDTYGSNPDRQGLFTHVFDEPSDNPAGYTIIVTATTVDGAYTANVQQAVVEATPTFYVNSLGTVGGGADYTLQAFFTDPGKDDPTYNINWGDGSTEATSGGTVFTHAYTFDPTGVNDHFNWTIVVTTADHTDPTDQSTPGYSYGGVVYLWATGAGTVNFSAPDTATEGQPVSASAAFSDTNQPSDQQGANEWFLDWGDGTAMSTWSGQQGQLRLANWQPEHTYAEPGSYTLRLGAGYADSTTTNLNYFLTQTRSITVQDVTPTVSLSGDAATVTDLEYDCSAVFTDPGSNDIPDQWTLDWGDGSSTLYLGNVTAFSHVFKRTSVGGNGATFNVTATAQTNDGDFNATTTVAVGKPVLDVMDAAGNLLDEQHRHTTGAFFVVNNDDETEQSDSSGNPIPDYLQGYTPNWQDSDLVNVILEPVPVAVGGSYTVTTDSPYLKLWKDPYRQFAVDAGTTFSATVQSSVWVEAIPGSAADYLTPMMGSEHIFLNWTAAAGALTKVAADVINATRSEITGPQSVPIHGEYRYHDNGAIPRNVPEAWGVDGGVLNDHKADWADAQWATEPGGPDSGWVGEISFTAGDFQSKPHQIYVVNITVSNPQPGPALTPANPSPIDNGAGLADNNILRKSVASGPFAKTNNNNDQPGLQWSADLLINGPVIQGKMYGADRITVGFVQNVTAYSDHGTYVKADGTVQGTLISALEARVARKPILDSRRDEHLGVKVWYSGLPGATLHPALNRNGVFVNSGTISSDDSPANGPPLGWNHASTLAPREPILQSMQFNEEFQLDVCAITSDQANTYAREATGAWTFNATGTVANDPANKYPWTKGQGAGVFPPPNGWQPVYDGSTPIITGPTMNELTKNERFRAA